MAKSPLILTLECAVFCDDVRSETSGKSILIGVYNHDIQPESFPARFLLHVWVQLRAQGKGRLPVNMRVTRDGAAIASGKLELEVDGAQQEIFAFAFPTPNLTIDKSCELGIDLQLPTKSGQKRWKTIKTLAVRERPKP